MMPDRYPRDPANIGRAAALMPGAAWCLQSIQRCMRHTRRDVATAIQPAYLLRPMLNDATRWLWLVLAGLLACSSGGCSLTALSAIGATGAVVQAGIEAKAAYSPPSFINGHTASVREVCIEYNSDVPLSDFLPALQMAFEERGVRSEVYNPGTAPPSCESRLVYNALIDYGKSTFADETTPYLSAIDLTLLQRNHILVTARYDVHGVGPDRYSSASNTLKRLVGQMVVDQLHPLVTPAKAASVPKA